MTSPRPAHVGILGAPLAVAAVFTLAGTLHFVFPQVYDRIVPAWVAPGLLLSARSATLLSGAAEVLGGVGMLHPGTRPAARLGLALLLLAVFPANVEMARHPESGYAQHVHLPAWLLWARLPLQPLLIWWVLRAGR